MLSLWEGGPQGTLMEQRVKDGGESEGRSVMEWIGVALPIQQHHPARKRADFRLVLDDRKGEAVDNEMFR